MSDKTIAEQAGEYERLIAARLKSPSAMIIPADVREILIGTAALIKALAHEVEGLKPYVDEG